MHLLVICQFDVDRIKIKQVIDRNTIILAFKASNSKGNNHNYSKFESVRDCMHVLLICKFGEDQMKNKRVIDRKTLVY